jgi:hypothetical protein
VPLILREARRTFGAVAEADRRGARHLPEFEALAWLGAAGHASQDSTWTKAVTPRDGPSRARERPR